MPQLVDELEFGIGEGDGSGVELLGHTDELLQSADLPYAGNAPPSTYMIDERQFVVIAASGQRNIKGPQGAAYVAFALP